MNSRASRSIAPAALAALGCLGFFGCTPSSCSEAAAEMNRGIALIEQYEYSRAYEIFDRLAAAHPGWVAAQVNRGLAALNLQKTEEKDYFPIAEESFGKALAIDPRCLNALVSRAQLFEHQYRIDEMLKDTTAAVAIDPEDPHVLYQHAVALINKQRRDEARPILERLVELQPSFASAHERLRQEFARSRDTEKLQAAVAEFKRLEDAQKGIKAGTKYGEYGKYNVAIRGTLPCAGADDGAWKPPAAPAFGPRVQISRGPAATPLRPDGKKSPPAGALGDLTGDGALEVVVFAERSSPEATTTAIYARDAAGAWKLHAELAVEAATGALGDIDGDFDLDVVTAGAGTLSFFINDGAGKLEEKPLRVDGGAGKGFPVRLYCSDADSDWDIDVVCLRQEAAADGAVASRLEIYNNNRDGSFREISAESGIAPLGFPAVELVAADLDGDVDVDFLVFDGASGRAQLFANDRAWRFRSVAMPDGAPRAPGIVSSASGDLDGDGDEDLVLFAGGSLRFWRSSGGLGVQFEEDPAFTARFGGVGGGCGVVADLRAEMRASLLVVDPRGADGSLFIASPDAAKAEAVAGIDRKPAAEMASAVAAVPAGCEAPALFVWDDAAGAGVLPVVSPGKWIVIDLAGPKTPVLKEEHANALGVGALVEVQSGVAKASVQLHGGGGGARAPSRAMIGLRGADKADFVRIVWPDGVLQVEPGIAGGCVQAITEVERKPSSCPVLFAWTASGYELVADFLGVGGLGYREGRDAFSRPDPTEYVLLPQLAVEQGEYRLEVLEPLEECTYLDELALAVVDHPADVGVLPDEMFAIRGPAPGFRLLAFRERHFPVAAVDENDVDVLASLLEVDRRYAGEMRRDPRFPGLARASRRIDLDFGAAIDGAIASAGAAAPFHLLLHGFVEYGYSTSNFAAWQADASFRAPTISVERQGRWVPLREEWGFPAGYPRFMAVDLGGLLARGDRRLRIETNMVIHWDCAFLAVTDAGASLRVTDLAADEATLGYYGFPPEEAPDGSVPAVYAWRDFAADPGYKSFSGSYTRFGDVRELIASADDKLAIFGPGEGLRLRFRADRLPPLAPGMRRTFLARTTGYCKDMDLYTAHPDGLEPLPFRAMSGYPYAAAEAFPSTPALDAYRAAWNTRPATTR